MQYSTQGEHTVTQSVGVIPVAVVPTPVDVVNTALTLVGTFVTFFFLVAGYSVVGRAWGAAHRVDAVEGPETVGVPDANN